MLILKLLVAWLAVATVLAVLHRCGVAAHEHGHGQAGTECQGCLFCPSAGNCLTANAAPRAHNSQEDRS